VAEWLALVPLHIQARPFEREKCPVAPTDAVVRLASISSAISLDCIEQQHHDTRLAGCSIDPFNIDLDQTNIRKSLGRGDKQGPKKDLSGSPGTNCRRMRTKAHSAPRVLDGKPKCSFPH